MACRIYSCGMPLSISGKNPFMDRNKEELIGRA
jgi:uncharacterized ferredoxin-like protein